MGFGYVLEEVQSLKDLVPIMGIADIALEYEETHARAERALQKISQSPFAYWTWKCRNSKLLIEESLLEKI